MLSGQESEGTREEANDDRADESDSNLIGIYPNGHANGKRQRINRQREQCPTAGSEPGNVEKNADDDYGGGSRDKCCKGYAFHHHHGAGLI